MREFLRAQTRDRHSELDRLAGDFGISSRVGYVRFLAAHAAALIPMERALSGAGAERCLPDWVARMRSGALLGDLRILGADHSESPVPVPDGEAEIFGMLYVLEGSRLGARVILDRIGDDVRITGATNYLRHGMAEKFWQSFLKKLEASRAAASHREATVSAANSAFVVFQRAFKAAQAS